MSGTSAGSGCQDGTPRILISHNEREAGLCWCLTTTNDPDNAKPLVADGVASRNADIMSVGPGP